MAGFKDYQLTIDKILRYSLYIAPDQKLVYAPPNLPKVEFTYSKFADPRQQARRSFREIWC